MRKNHVWTSQILISLASASALAQTPTMSHTPPSRNNIPPVSLGLIVPMNNPNNTMYYDPDDRRFYNPQRNESDFNNLKAPPMGYHYEMRDGRLEIIRN